MPAPKQRQGDVAVAAPQRSIGAAPSNVIAQFPQMQAAQALQRAIAGPIAAVKRADILALQRTIGNRAVRQLLAAGSARQAAPLERQSPEEEDDEVQMKSLPGGAAVHGSAAEPPRENATGLPDQLKAGVEALSGFAMDDVRVHYNSDQPATVQALAYAQGTDIYLGPGEEKHLPHEAWHVAQQKQGRVKPTLQSKGVAINDDAGLEDEADVMGARALAMDGPRPRAQLSEGEEFRASSLRPTSSDLPIQAKLPDEKQGLSSAQDYVDWFQGKPKDALFAIFAKIGADAKFPQLKTESALKKAGIIDNNDVIALKQCIADSQGRPKKVATPEIKKLEPGIWQHIWRGDFSNEKKRPTGYHWKGFGVKSWLVGDDDTKSDVFYEEEVTVRGTKVEEIHNATNVAKGEIEGKKKEDKSTFFPDTWEEPDVKKAIETRNSTGNIKDKDGKYIDGVTLVKSGGTIYPSIEK